MNPAASKIIALKAILIVPTLFPVFCRNVIPMISIPPVEIPFLRANPVPIPFEIAPKIAQMIGSVVKCRVTIKRIIILDKITQSIVNRVKWCPIFRQANTNKGRFKTTIINGVDNGKAVCFVTVAINCAAPVIPEA